jgi:hypothetical protein
MSHGQRRSTPATVIIKPYKKWSTRNIWLTLYYDRCRIVEEYLVSMKLFRGDFMRGILIFTMFITMILSVGCSNLDEASNTFEETTKIKAEDFKIYEDSFLAENIKEDLDGDGEQEIIKMYIQPTPLEDKENKGQYLWDDTHFWQLIVFAGDKTYPLFNNHLSGKLKFWIENNEGQKTIVLLKDGMELSLTTFRYNADGYFDRKEHYKSTGVPPLIRSSTIK